MSKDEILTCIAITHVLALLSAPVTTQTLREGCLHVRALFRPPEGSYDRHAQPSAKPADGSQLAPPPQPARGAAAPSSLPSPIRCGPDQKHYSGIAPSSERIASGCTKQAQSHLQLYGILTEITHCSRRILQTTQIGHGRRARIVNSNPGGSRGHCLVVAASATIVSRETVGP